jgi:hypothetical protein
VTEPIKSVDMPVVGELKRALKMAIRPTGAELQLAEVVTAPPALSEVAPSPSSAGKTDRTLPATASRLPPVGLVGTDGAGGGVCRSCGCNSEWLSCATSRPQSTGQANQRGNERGAR